MLDEKQQQLADMEQKVEESEQKVIKLTQDLDKSCKILQFFIKLFLDACEVVLGLAEGQLVFNLQCHHLILAGFQLSPQSLLMMSLVRCSHTAPSLNSNLS